MFSKSCEYGIRSLIFIAMKSKQGARVNIKDIALAIDSPRAFTAKILQQLVKANIVASVRGPNGGFYMDSNFINRLTLTEIVAAIDGDSIYNGCGLGLTECNDLTPCPLHQKFNKVREHLREMLDATTLEDLASQLEQGTAFLKL